MKLNSMITYETNDLLVINYSFNLVLNLNKYGEVNARNRYQIKWHYNQ